MSKITINITVKGEQKQLTLDEAFALKKQLDELFEYDEIDETKKAFGAFEPYEYDQLISDWLQRNRQSPYSKPPYEDNPYWLELTWCKTNE